MGWNGCVFFKKGNPYAFPARSAPIFRNHPLSLLRSQLPRRGKRWSLRNAKASPTRRGVTEGDGEVVQRDSKDGHCFIL